MAWEEWPTSPGADGKGLDNDPLLEWLGDDPTTRGDYFVVVGIVGKAPKPDTWRIYLNYSLSEFYEVAEGDIQYATTTEDDEYSRVWIRSGADIRHVRQVATRAERFPGLGPKRGSRRSEAFFLTGPFANGDEFALADDDEEGGPQTSGCSCRRSN
jgi:hypothetical protein